MDQWKLFPSNSILISLTCSRSWGDPRRRLLAELVVLGLYGQGELSSGRAAELLGQQREDFIRYASAKGIPYFQMTGEEVRREVDRDKL